MSPHVLHDKLVDVRVQEEHLVPSRARRLEVRTRLRLLAPARRHQVVHLLLRRWHALDVRVQGRQAGAFPVRAFLFQTALEAKQRHECVFVQVALVAADALF